MCKILATIYKCQPYQIVKRQIKIRFRSLLMFFDSLNFDGIKCLKKQILIPWNILFLI